MATAQDPFKTGDVVRLVNDMAFHAVSDTNRNSVIASGTLVKIKFRYPLFYYYDVQTLDNEYFTSVWSNSLEHLAPLELLAMEAI